MSFYFDHQTTARLSSKALEAMLPFLREQWNSLAAPYTSVSPAIKKAYESIYALIGASEHDHFIFTSSGAEAVNHVIFSSYLDITRKTGKNHFVTSVIDEAPAIMAMERLHELGCISELAPVEKNGQVSARSIAETISPRTALVSLSWANGLTGVVNPISEIASICKERGILLHVDATHVLGKGYFPWHDCDADILTFNGEQLHAPKGTGGLFVRAGLDISPFIVGGNEQAGLRGGSFNIPALIALGAACEEAMEFNDYFCTEIVRLRYAFEAYLCEKISGARVFFQDTERLPHVSSIDFPGVTSDAFLYLLSRKGVYASLGGGNFQQIAHLMRATGNETHSALSFSFSRESTQEEMEKGSEKIVEVYQNLKKCSQYLEVM